MAEELARHGYKMSPGTLYPLLHGLERKGYLKSSPGVLEKLSDVSIARHPKVARLWPQRKEKSGNCLLS